jgi:hypothetical protein
MEQIANKDILLINEYELIKLESTPPPAMIEESFAQSVRSISLLLRSLSSSIFVSLIVVSRCLLLSELLFLFLLFGGN